MKTTGRKILLALVAFILTIAVIAITYDFRRQLGWWAFIDCFALFMMVFTWLMSILIGKMIPHSGKLLANIALIFGVLFVVALIVEFVVYSYI